MPIRYEEVYDGDTHPIATNNTGEDRAKNRRIKIKLIP